MVAFNILSTVKAALKSVHGVGKVKAGLSDYYLVEEVQATYRGMTIALPAPLWLPIAQMSLTEFVTRSATYAERRVQFVAACAVAPLRVPRLVLKDTASHKQTAEPEGRFPPLKKLLNHARVSL